jgi:hypothetical protein
VSDSDTVDGDRAGGAFLNGAGSRLLALRGVAIGEACGADQGECLRWHWEAGIGRGAELCDSEGIGSAPLGRRFRHDQDTKVDLLSRVGSYSPKRRSA